MEDKVIYDIKLSRSAGICKLQQELYKTIQKENNKGFDELREQSLEDVYNVLCKNEPSKNSKKHKEWSYLESIAYEELLMEDERPHDCTKIINEIVDYLEREWKKCDHI